MVVGGGPGGVVLAYLLARAGVDVTLLESRGDFDRRFRGDSLAPPVLDHLDRLGIAEPLLADIPHVRADAFVWSTPEKRYVLADYRDASNKFPFYALVPQARFLPWVVERARPYGLEVRMGARVTDLLRDDAGRVVGVGYTQHGERRTLYADLVVGSDGRNSKVRQLSVADGHRAELQHRHRLDRAAPPRRRPAALGPRADVRARPQPRRARAGRRLAGRVHDPHRHVRRDAGRRAPSRSGPCCAGGRRGWTDRVDLLTDVNQLTLLPIRITQLDRWSEPGLLLIGDAAHVISPVGGNGINFAIVDAAEAANRLVGPLTAGRVDPAAVDAATAEVERVRRPRVDREQAFQVRVERATAQRLRGPRRAAPGAAAAAHRGGAGAGAVVGPPRCPRARRASARPADHWPFPQHDRGRGT